MLIIAQRSCMWQRIANPSRPAWRSLAGIRPLEHLPDRLTSPALPLRGGHTKAEQLLNQLADHERQGVPDGAGTDAAAGFDLVTMGLPDGSAEDCVGGADGCCCSAGPDARVVSSPGESSAGLACRACGRHQREGFGFSHAQQHPPQLRIQGGHIHKVSAIRQPGSWQRSSAFLQWVRT